MNASARSGDNPDNPLPTPREGPFGGVPPFDRVRTADFAPALEAEAKHVLGEPEREVWFEYAADPTSGSPNLLFHYPSHQPTGFDELQRAVKLEFGSLTDQQPVGHHAITPWLLDALPDAMPDWQCDVVALGIDRTSWEKADPPCGASSSCGQGHARPVLTSRCGCRGPRTSPGDRKRNRRSRNLRTGRGLETAVLRQRVGELRNRTDRLISLAAQR